MSHQRAVSHLRVRSIPLHSAAVAALLVAAALLAIVIAGCGGQEGPQRVVVSGAVTYQGQPVSEGKIRFSPAEGTEAPPSGTFIVQGQYVADAKGGVPVGTHKVQIEAFRPDPNFQKPAGPLPTGITEEELGRVQYIPEKYNKRTELQITIPPGSDPITQDFELIE